MDKRKYKDRAVQNKAAVAKRRRKIKILAVEYKGGKCTICGYDKCIRALEFHHLGNKNFTVATYGCRAWSKLKPELDKCILVCANCHRELEAGLSSNGRITA